jgi:hypothetical protein
MNLWVFCNAREIFPGRHRGERFSCSRVAGGQQGQGVMGIDTLILILILTFGVGFVLNRVGDGRRSRRTGLPS